MHRDWPEWAPMNRCAVPEYVPDVAAGAKSPLRLTEWKVSAIKLAILMEKQKSVSRADFKALGIDARRWIDNRWLVVDAQSRALVPGPGYPNFKKQHPRVYVGASDLAASLAAARSALEGGTQPERGCGSSAKGGGGGDRIGGERGGGEGDAASGEEAARGRGALRQLSAADSQVSSAHKQTHTRARNRAYTCDCLRRG